MFSICRPFNPQNMYELGTNYTLICRIVRTVIKCFPNFSSHNIWAALNEESLSPVARISNIILFYQPFKILFLNKMSNFSYNELWDLNDPWLNQCILYPQAKT